MGSGVEDRDYYDRTWYAWWGALDTLLTKLPRDPHAARRVLCAAANEWGRESALAAMIMLLAPLGPYAEDHCPAMRPGGETRREVK
jgi:hypothetical protein